MIKVVLTPQKEVKVSLKPEQGIQIDATKKYLFDPSVVQEYVDISADNAQIAIDKANEATNTFNDITVFVDNSKQELNQIVADGEVAIDGYVDEAEQEIKQIAQQAAEDAIQGAADEATRRAINQTTELVDNEIEPRLQEYASNAEADAANAAESAGHAAQSASDADHYAEDARIWAEGEQAEVEEIGGELSSRGYADFAQAITNTPEDVPLDQSKILALDIIRGPKGDKGDKGDRGDDGIKGELNNPFTLFDVKWADHTLDNASWALAGSYVDGSVYTTAYEELLAEYEQGADSTDGDISYRLTPKGYRIALVSQETAVNGSFSSKGIAWYYILDIANTRFRLPRTKYAFVGARDTAGKYVAHSLPNITGNFVGGKTDAASGANLQSGAFVVNGTTGAYQGNTGPMGLYSFNASRVSGVYQDGAPVQQRATEMYLYFYIGETIVGANIIDYTRQLNEVVDDGIDRITQTSDAEIAEIAQSGDDAVTGITQASDTELAKITQAGEEGAELVRSTVEAILTGDKVLEGSLLIQTPPADDNSQRAVNSEWVNNALKDVGPSGGGLEIGDIGIAISIDESKNKRRYLNGQTILQEQFVSFTEWLREKASLYPNIVTTEENWQAEVTNSKLGQCGKFVIGEDTIRLPKVVNVDGLADLTFVGGIKAESLPNITGKTNAIFIVAGSKSADGCLDGMEFTKSGTYFGGSYIDSPNWNITQSGGEDYTQVKIDASLSSSTYQDNAPVQQEAIQYPYFIQVATGVEESVDVTREIELNNPFSLLDYKWSEYELSNASWLLSNGSFHSGTVYKSVYELLLKIKNGTETKDGVSVKLSTEAYEDTDFVINTADTTFRLPLLNGSETMPDYNDGVNISHNTDFIAPYNGVVITCGRLDSGLSYLYINGAPVIETKGSSAGNTGDTFTAFVKKGDVVKVVYGNEFIKGTFYPLKGSGSLYFYVGETIQDANVINAGKALEIIAALANADYVVESKVATDDDPSWYRVYKSGWVEQGGISKVSKITFIKTMKDTSYFMSAIPDEYSTNGGSISVNYSSVSVSGATINLRWDGGYANINDNCYRRWEVKGMGAK